MLSKAKIKYIRSLDLKKNRKKDNVFVAEGPKLVEELLGHFTCVLLAAQPQWLNKNTIKTQASEIIETNYDDLSKASFLKTPQDVIAIFKQPSYNINSDLPENELCLALDGIQDPGNLGTIIRLADWFGFEHIICSLSTVDVFNPKTVQATMGALARIQVHYVQLDSYIKNLKENTPIYGTFLKGKSLYEQPLSTKGLIVMGNEGNGISPEIENLVNKRIYIPNYPSQRKTSESLNVAIATSIICSEFRRRML